MMIIICEPIKDQTPILFKTTIFMYKRKDILTTLYHGTSKGFATIVKREVSR